MSYSLFFLMFNIIIRGVVVEKYLSKRVLEEGAFLTENKTTIRNVAKIFNISKSTVHKDLTKRLPLIDKILSKKVEETLSYNYSIKHIRGGEKTRQKHQRF